MKDKIIVVDDESITLTIIKEILEKEGHSVETYEDATEFLIDYPDLTGVSMILSDYFMPKMDGQRFLLEVRSKNEIIPFVFLTSNSDLSKAIELMQQGANDFISKPIQKDGLLFRIEKNLDDFQRRRVLSRVKKEKEIREAENSTLVNWKDLYASKDIRQTEQFMGLFTRTVNQSGAFIWLQMLKDGIEKIDENNYMIQNSLVDLIIKAAEKYQNVYDQISFISQLDNFKLVKDKIYLDDLKEKLTSFLKEKMDYVEGHKRSLRFFEVAHVDNKYIEIDFFYLKKIVLELIVNGIKYSPEDTEILCLWDINYKNRMPFLEISVLNSPREMNAEDLEGNPIVGIPYEYSEMVFDLFYTIENTPQYIEGEKWSDGMGLFVARKLLKRQNAWLEQKNGIDYTHEPPKPFVRFTISIPIQ